MVINTEFNVCIRSYNVGSGQFQRNGHDIQTVFCTSRHLTEEVAGFKHFSLSLSGTFKYQEHTHEISPNFIERF